MDNTNLTPAQAAAALTDEQRADLAKFTSSRLGEPEHAATQRAEPDPRDVAVIGGGSSSLYMDGVRIGTIVRESVAGVRNLRERDIAAWNKAVDERLAAKRAGRSRP